MALRLSKAEFDRQFEDATRRGEYSMKYQPLATAVKWHRTQGLVLDLNNGVRLIVPLSFLPELRHATHKQLIGVQIVPPGTTLEWPEIDEHIGILELLNDLLGETLSPLMAKELGRRGGQAITQAKATAARANGAKGGRPKKKPATKS